MRRMPHDLPIQRRRSALLGGVRLPVFALAAALSLAAPGIACAQEAVAVRAVPQAFFGRVTFGWPAPVQHQARVNGTTATITFDRPFQGDVAAIAGGLRDYVSNAVLADGGRSVVLTMTGPHAVRTTVNGNSVLVDLRKSGGATAAAPPAEAAPRPSPPPSPVAGAPAVSGQADVRVRAAPHETYTRVVFDWPANVTYTLDKDGDQLRLRFSRPGRVDLAPLTRGGLPLVTGATSVAAADGTSVDVRVDPATRVRHFRNGASVVVDILRGADTAAAAPARPAAAPAPAVPAAPQREVAASPAPPLPAVTAAAPPRPAAAPAPAARAEAGNLTVSVASGPNGPATLFEWTAPVPAAVFERAGYVWVVFDRTGPTEIVPVPPELRDSVMLVENMRTAAGGSAFRLKVKQGLVPSATRVDAAWRVEFRAAPQAPSEPIEVRRDTAGAGGPRVLLPVPEAGGRVAIADPEVGDDLIVVPVLQGGRGVPAERTFAEFRVLASNQGVVVSPWIDDVQVQSGADGVAITAARGLILSAALPAASAAESLPAVAAGTSPPPARAGLLRFAEWARGPVDQYQKNHDSLLMAMATAGDNERSAARLKLAQFYLAHGMAAEALGLVRLIERTDASADADPGLRAVRGAAQYLMGRLPAAERDLMTPAFAVDPTVSLFRGGILAGKKEWVEARQEFAIGMLGLSTLPPQMQAHFQLLAARSALESADLNEAASTLGSFNAATALPRQVSEGKLLFARLRIAKGEQGPGMNLLEEVVKEDIRPVAPYARMVLVEERLKAREIALPEAINELDSMRHVWRGGDFEFALLKRLADLQLERRDYRAALNTMRQVVSVFEKRPESKDVAAQMETVFRDLFSGGGADTLPPVAALGLYFDFRQLTPLGKDGDVMIRQLSDRLVGVDLLSQAAQLLQHQVSFRLRGEERAAVAGKLAAIYLLDKQPLKALETLGSTRFRQVPVEVARERKFLEAQAFMELQRYSDATVLLRGDDSKEAETLRAEMAWRQANWAEAAQAYQKVLNRRWESQAPLTVTERNQLMQNAISLVLSDNFAGAEALRKQFQPLMAETTEADAFDLITTNIDKGSINFRQVAGRIAQIDVLNSFLDRYRRSASGTRG